MHWVLSLILFVLQPAKATGTTPIHIEPIGRHPSVLEHTGTRHKSPKDRPSSPQSSRRHVSLGERWGNPHVRRQFRKLETKFNKKFDELTQIKQQVAKLEALVTTLISENSKKPDTKAVSSQVLKEVHDEFDERFINLDSSIQKTKEDYVNAIFDIYRHMPNDPSDSRFDRDSGFPNENGSSDTMKPAVGTMFEKDNGRMLIIGGISRYVDDSSSKKTKFYRRSDVFSFDPRTRSTSKLESLPEVRSHHCAVVYQRRVYVIGGATRGDKALNSALLRVGDAWEEVEPMGEPRMGLSCAVFRGRIWACGGRNGQIRYATCEAYHPSEGWRTESSMSEARYLSIGVSTARGLYIIGGSTTRYRGGMTVELLPVNEDRFKPGPEPPNLSGVSGAAGVVIKDAIFLMGGQLTNRRYPQEILVLWPHANDWQRIGEMKLARRGFHTAFLGGYLYVIGGNDKVGNEVFDMAQFYDRQVCTEPNSLRGTSIEISHQAGLHQPLVRSYHAIVTYTP